MTERDKAIRRCIDEFGPLTIEHLIELAHKEPSLGKGATLWRRLRPDRPLVANRQIFVCKRGSTLHHVYAIYDIRRRKDFDHDLLLASIHIALHINFTVLEWKQAREKCKGAVNEDAYCILGIPLPTRLGQLHYFIEADTGSEGYGQIEDKVKRYVAYFQKSQEPFFVLLVTTNEARVTELASRARQWTNPEVRRLFLFTTLQAIQSNPQGAICAVPFETALQFIVPSVSL